MRAWIIIWLVKAGFVGALIENRFHAINSLKGPEKRIAIDSSGVAKNKFTATIEAIRTFFNGC